MKLTWGAHIRAKGGQQVSGDGYDVIEGKGSRLLTIVDGLGGGVEAARPTALALDVLRANPDKPLKELIERCHTALHGTRGAVIGLLRLEENNQRASYIGVGNIGIHVVSDQMIKPISKNGILGHRQLPTLLEMTYTYNIGDLFMLYSDGISTRVISDSALNHPPADLKVLAVDLLERYGKTIDDATVLVAKPH
ncbi:MAG: SpoIIE family protein phosphatase [Herpetosiphonaceae bacterium]|nr:SpoIIE family protein phosphatase [Herpetosiphonaceae bacterium]